MLPTFVVVGAPKCGTTSLHHYLAQHPDVFLPTRKELHYFSAPELTANARGPADDFVLGRLVTDEADYRAQYEGATGFSAVGDVSPSYLYWAGSAERVRALLGPVHVVALVRDPAEKAFSQWTHQRRAQRETLSLADALDAEPERTVAGWSDFWRYLDSSRYAPGVAEYQRVFGREAVTVIPSDDLAAEPERVVRALFARLGVDPGAPLTTDARRNRSGEARSARAQLLISRKHPLKEALKRVVPERTRERLLLRATEWNTGAKPDFLPADRERLRTALAPGRAGAQRAARHAGAVDRPVPQGLDGADGVTSERSTTAARPARTCSSLSPSGAKASTSAAGASRKSGKRSTVCGTSWSHSVVSATPRP